MMIWAIMMLAGGSSLVQAGDFDRDGRLDRAYVLKEASGYRVVVARSSGDVITVVSNVPASETFTLTKLERAKRRVVCDPIVTSRVISRYVCDAGDILRFGDTADTQTAAIWMNGRFVIYPIASQQP